MPDKLGEIGAGNHKLIVLEGCDGVGKTVLTSRLVEEFGYQRLHSPASPDGVDLVARYERIIEKAGSLVMDRSFISELVYGPLYRGKSRLAFDDVVGLCQQAIDHGGLLVHVTAPADVIRARLRERDGEQAGADDVDKIMAMYAKVFTDLEASGITACTYYNV